MRQYMHHEIILNRKLINSNWMEIDIHKKTDNKNMASHLLNLDINNMDQKTHWFQLNGNYSFNLIKFFFSFGEQSISWKDMSRCHLIVILNGFYSIVLLLPSVAKKFENHLPMLRVSLIAIHSIFYFCKKNLLV